MASELPPLGWAAVAMVGYVLSVTQEVTVLEAGGGEYVVDCWDLENWDSFTDVAIVPPEIAQNISSAGHSQFLLLAAPSHYLSATRCESGWDPVFAPVEFPPRS